MANFGQGDEVVSKPTSVPTKSSWGSDDEVVTKPTPKQEAKPTDSTVGELTKSFIGGTASALDFPLSAPGFIAATGTELLTTTGSMLASPFTGETPKQAYQRGAKASEAVGQYLMNPMQKLVGLFQEADYYSNAPLPQLMGWFSDKLQKGGEKLEAATGIPSEAVPLVTNVGMLAAGAKGVKTGQELLKEKQQPFKVEEPVKKPKAPAKDVPPPPPPGATPEQVNAFKAKVKKESEQRTSSSPLVEAAIRNKDTGEIERMGPKHDEQRKAQTVNTHDQGFLDERGNFLTREEAVDRAVNTNQVPVEQGKPVLTIPEDGLHSGDLRAAGDKRFEIGGTSNMRPVTLDDTTPPKYVYHGTKVEPQIDADGNLILMPSKNFESKTSSVSLTHNQDVATDYSARIKGGGPEGFDFNGAKTIKIHSDALPDSVRRESGEEWAINTQDPVTIPKGKFEIIDHPLSKDATPESHKAEVDRLQNIVDQRGKGEYKEPDVEWNKPKETSSSTGKSTTTLKDGSKISISTVSTPDAFSNIVRMQHGEPISLVAKNEAGEEVGRLTYMPDGGPIGISVREQDRRKGVATALYGAHEAAGGKLPAVDSGVAISDEARAVRKARDAAKKLSTDTTPVVAKAFEKVDPRSVPNEEEMIKHATDIYERYGEAEAVKFFEDYQKNLNERSIPVPNTPETLDDALHKVNTFESKDKSEHVVGYKENTDKGVTAEDRAKWFDMRERGEELPPEAKAILDEIDAENLALVRKIKAMGGDVGDEFATGQSRIRLFSEKEKPGWKETIKEFFSNKMSFGDKVGEKVNAAIERKVFGLDVWSRLKDSEGKPIAGAGKNKSDRVIELHRHPEDTKFSYIDSKGNKKTVDVKKGTSIWEWRNGEKELC